MSQTRIDTPRILLGLPPLLIHADQLLATARVLAKTVVRDSIKPRGKSRFTPKASNILVSSEKSFLCKVIGQSEVCAGELPQQTAHAGLMAAHKFAERVLIVVGKNSRNEVRIRKLHSRNITVSVAEEEFPFCLLISIQLDSRVQLGTELTRTTTRRLPSH